MTPHPFKLFETGLRADLPAKHAGPDFWRQAHANILGNKLEFLAAGNSSAPSGLRIWLLVHRMGAEEVGAAAGLALTGALLAGGRRTVLIDADEAESVLTRRSGRIFRAGWLDMARYGTSLTAATTLMDWPGERGHFLGLGSYCPPEITAEEIREFVARLERGVDELVVVCGPGPEVKPWADAAHHKLYCWDRELDSQEVFTASLLDLQKKKLECPGVLAFGSEPAPEPAPAPVPEPVPVPEPEPSPEPVPAPEPMGEPEIPAVDPLSSPEETHSSGIFRVVAISGLVIVTLLALFIWKFTGFGSSRIVEPPSGDEWQSGGLIAAADSVVSDSMVIASAAMDSSKQEDASVDSVLQAPEDSVKLDIPAVAPVDSSSHGDQAPDLAQSWALVAAAFSEPAGEKPWCLHVYSLADSLSAAREIKMMKRRGVSAVMEPVVLPDSSSWYRVYAGNFATEADASLAEPALKWKLRTDWARPTILNRSARD